VVIRDLVLRWHGWRDARRSAKATRAELRQALALNETIANLGLTRWVTQSTSRDGTGLAWRTIYAHGADKCAPFPCVVHGPSDHHMREWPTVFHGDRGRTDRICPRHGEFHPDPDDVAMLARRGLLIVDHACECRCCVEDSGRVGDA
jgi:hypothetical protein